MRRRLIGIVALICLGASLILAATRPWSSLQQSLLFSTSLRLGLTLGAIWLAYPQVEALVRRISPWWIGMAALVIVMLVVRPRVLLLLVPLLLLIAALGWLRRFLQS